MPNVKHIDIPVPCSRPWEQMSQSSGGRFCHQCHKTVLDFTGLTNRQIIDIIAGSSKVCARVDSSQLSSLNDSLERQIIKTAPNIWRRIAVVAAVIWSIPFLKTEAQSKPATVQLPAINKDSKPVNTPADTITYRTITGKIIADQSKPVANATIHTLNGGISTNSNASGDFKIKVPVTTKYLEVSSVGCIDSIIQLDKKSDYQIPVSQMTIMFIGEVTVPSLTQKQANQ